MSTQLLLLWHTLEELHPWERDDLEARFEQDLEFKTIRPRSPMEHQNLCIGLRPRAVLAPRQPLGIHTPLPFSPTGETLARIEHLRFVYEPYGRKLERIGYYGGQQFAA